MQLRFNNFCNLFSAIVVIALFTIASPVSASDSSTVANGQTLDITAHSVCKRVTNNSGQSQYVPTVAALEWSNFYGTSHPGVTITNCPTACGGTSYGGYCWYFSPVNQNCNVACAGHGGCNLAGITAYGSSGTISSCMALLTAMSAPPHNYAYGPPGDYPSSGGGEGCFVGFFGSGPGTYYYWQRDTDITTCEGQHNVGFIDSDNRACSCNN